MNRFIIENTPQACAEAHCDKHVPKMYVEEAQMLCTAHRILDGKLIMVPAFDKQGNQVYLKSGKKRFKKHWELPDDREFALYKAAHMRHPCTLWCMETAGNYRWAYQLFQYIGLEYQHRYGKPHKTDELDSWLFRPPNNINPSKEITPMPLAMGSNPECMDPDDVIGSYRKFYQTKQHRFKMTWTNRQVPSWFKFAA